MFSKLDTQFQLAIRILFSPSFSCQHDPVGDNHLRSDFSNMLSILNADGVLRASVFCGDFFGFCSAFLNDLTIGLLGTE